MSTAPRPTILLIMGSVRVGRRCPQITTWVRGLVEAEGALACRTVDLKEWPLPPDDEPGIPAVRQGYRQPHTRAWSETVLQAAGIIIVTPQYNWGYPAPLKNALDHLYREWNGKALMIVTYGGHGGGKCAAALRQVAEGLKMRIAATSPAVTLPREAIETDRPLTEAELVPHAAAVRQAAGELASLVIGDT